MRASLILLTLFIVSACNHTSYQAVGETSEKADSQATRTVIYHLDPDFYRDPPNCVVVMPIAGAENKALAHYVEKSIARHLVTKVERVITPLGRRRIEQQQGYDLQNAGDMKRFAYQERCPFHIRASLEGTEEVYALVWSDKRVGIVLSLHRTADDKALWRAAHVARRGEGGLPISPFSLISSAAAAGAFQSDGEATASVADDAMRRVMRTLPDLR